MQVVFQALDNFPGWSRQLLRRSNKPLKPNEGLSHAVEAASGAQRPQTETPRVQPNDRITAHPRLRRNETFVPGGVPKDITSSYSG